MFSFKQVGENFVNCNSIPFNNDIPSTHISGKIKNNESLQEQKRRNTMR